ncbi:MAG: ABC transporter ATP-binding protein/permease [Butyrivibrio sp.]|nr:ABC transporter ATP-binding protein/permease [Butyrivibrio sp.]
MLKKVFSLLDKKDKEKLLILFLLDIGSMIVSLFGIAVIVPYIFILFEPSEAQSYPVFKNFVRLCPDDNNIKYLLAASGVVLVLYALSCAYRLFYDYISTRIMLKMLQKYSRYLLKWYYERPYDYFFTNHTADIIHRYSVAALNLINGILVAALELAAKVLTLILLVLLLFIMGREEVLIPIAFLAVLCLWMYELTKDKVQDYSRQMNEIGRWRSIKLQESFRGITELRMSGKTDMAYGWQVQGENESYRVHIKRNLLMSAPNLLIDIFTLIMVLAVLLISYTITGDLKDGIVVLSVTISAALQIRDTVMEIFGSFHEIRQNAGAYEEVFDELEAATKEGRSEKSTKNKVPDFEESIEVKKATYHYPGFEEIVLENFNLKIKKGEMIGFKGTSGGGKTTLIKLILGLLCPNEGEVLLDGKNIDQFGDDYLQLFGYVPQDIFLMDMTIAQNIAMEDDYKNIDMDKVRRALEVAQLWDFVSSLSEGVHTNIGENGVRLSGGQRQRLGIARAIYGNVKILVFDESTNALDKKTQEQFIETIRALKNKYTIIMIAHSDDALKYCDRVVEI